MLGIEIGDGGCEHSRLAGAGRADDEYETIVASHGAGGAGLEHVEPGAIERLRRCRRVALGLHRRELDFTPSGNLICKLHSRCMRLPRGLLCIVARLHRGSRRCLHGVVGVDGVVGAGGVDGVVEMMSMLAMMALVAALAVLVLTALMV